MKKLLIGLGTFIIIVFGGYRLADHLIMGEKVITFKSPRMVKNRWINPAMDKRLPATAMSYRDIQKKVTKK